MNIPTKVSDSIPLASKLLGPLMVMSGRYLQGSGISQWARKMTRTPGYHNKKENNEYLQEKMGKTLA